MKQQMEQQEETVTPAATWGVPARMSAPPAVVGPESFAERPLTRAEAEAANPLIYRLRRKSPVRELALAALRGETLTTIAPLLEALNHPSGNGWKSRQVAAWTLGRAKLDAEQQAVASETLLRVLGGQLLYDGGRVVRGLLRTLLAALLLATPWLFTWEGDWLTIPLLLIGTGLILGIFCSPVTLTISFNMDDEKVNRVRAAAAEALGNLGRPETVGTLLAAHFERNNKVRSAATSALRKVLPTLTSDHYGQLEPTVVPNLCRALAHWEPSFVLDAVEALGKVGDGRAAAALERLERTERRTEVRKAIARILPTLLERKRREEESGMLLRGTAAPTAQQELLRPAITQSADEAKETLLRATQGDKES